MNPKKRLLQFVEQSTAFDNNSKLKMLLLISGTKPSTFIHLRIQKNLHDKHEFEELLKQNGIIFDASRPKGYEEIQKIEGTAIKWKFNGTWYGYDLFKNKQYNQRFLEYVTLLRQKKHELADKMAGKLYGYPDCCIQRFINENHKKKPIKKTYYEYYKDLHDSDKAFPYISHTPCSSKCKQTKKLNKMYEKAIKKTSKKFNKEYSAKKTYQMQVIIDIENEISGVWKQKNGHDYILITQKPINEKYYLISWLTKAQFKRGTILHAQITIQYDYATIKIIKKTGEIKNLHHERKIPT